MARWSGCLGSRHHVCFKQEPQTLREAAEAVGWAWTQNPRLGSPLAPLSVEATAAPSLACPIP